MQALYPATITYIKDDPAFPNGVYTVEFPDIEGCATFGLTLPECYNNATDALNLVLSSLQTDGVPFPPVTDIREIVPEKGQIVTLIKADTRMYKRKYKRIFKK